MLCLLLILFLELNLHRALPSDEIWNKTQIYIKEGKMNAPIYLQYFIFDESNYTALDINSEKMNYLYLKQFELSCYGILNYIFIVDELNQSIEPLANVTHNLAAILNKQHFINKDYALILFISNNTLQFRIRTGAKIKKDYSDYILEKMSANLWPFLHIKDYYNACISFINNSISVVYKNNYNIYEYNTTYTGYSSNKTNKIVAYIPIIFAILSLVIIFLIRYCCCKKRKEKEQVREFLTF